MITVEPRIKEEDYNLTVKQILSHFEKDHIKYNAFVGSIPLMDNDLRIYIVSNDRITLLDNEMEYYSYPNMLFNIYKYVNLTITIEGVDNE